MDYLKKVDEIVYLLSEINAELVIHQIKSAKLMGGTGGEIFSIICSLLKTHEIQNPELFNVIRKPAYEIFDYAQSLGRTPHANFDLLDELSR
jgi:hypothetical protein